MKLTSENHDPNSQKDHLQQSEDLYNAQVLIRKIKSRPDLFKPVTTTHEKVLEKLHKNQRMQYILEELALIPSFFEYPAVKEKKLRNQIKIISRNIQKETRKGNRSPSETEAIIQRTIGYLDSLVDWLLVPIIYDTRGNKQTHDDRRMWRDELTNLFDFGEGRKATGPFSDTYVQNKLSSNVTNHVFAANLIPLQLQQVGLKNTIAEETALKIKQLNTEFHQIDHMDHKEKIYFFNTKLIPLVRALLTQLAHREYTSTQVEAELDANDHEFGQEPDWLNEHFPSSSDF